MIRDRLIVCIASAWEYDPTGKHHLMRILARHNDVLWVNYHGTRRPGFNRADARASLAALRRVARGVTRISDTMWQVTPLVVPGARRRLTRFAGQRLLARQIRRAIARVVRPTRQVVQLWLFAPDVPDLIGRLGEEGSVYYCVDEFSEFEGVDAASIRNAEQSTLRRADVVVTTSEPLLDARRAIRPDAVLVRHGVDFDHFASAWRQTPLMPDEVRAIPRPVFGFFGLIEHWIDIELLEAVAKRRPYYSFVLIGEACTDVSRLRRLTNVHLLGRRPYRTLPSYAAAFDAALLPFAQTTMTRHVNPVKLLEYLAAGLRIVSTPLPEAARFPREILIGDTAGSFAQACDRILDEATTYPRNVVAQTAIQETWEARVEQLSEIVMRRIHGGVEIERVRPAADVLRGVRPPHPLPAESEAMASHAGAHP